MIGFTPRHRIIIDHPVHRMQLSDRVTVSDEFRAEMDAWLLDFFGYAKGVEQGNPLEMRTAAGLFYVVHPADYAEVSRALNGKGGSR